MQVDYDDYMAIGRQLMECHEIFHQFWATSKPIFTRSLETAAVGFDKHGKQIIFKFNPDFWELLTNYERAFVIAHEMAHVFLNHGIRIQGLLKLINSQKLINIAADIVVNESLFSWFNFELEKMPTLKEMTVTYDAYFAGTNVLRNQTVEYYFHNLSENKSPNCKLINDHSHLIGFGENEIQEILKQISESLQSDDNVKNITPEDLKRAFGNKAGTDSLTDIIYTIQRLYQTTIKPWKRFFEESLKSIWSIKNSKEYHWVGYNRRWSLIKNDFIIPTTAESNKKVQQKVRTRLYIDCSGSCVQYVPKFIDIARSIPLDKFEVECYGFDTSIYPLELKDNNHVLGGGGTAFDIIENHIQTTSEIYPDKVFIITDGEGTPVSPEFPDRWHWIVTPVYDDSYIRSPSKCTSMDQHCD